MDEVLRLFQAFVAPAIFVSAISLLLLSVNVRLMGIVGRLRQYNRAKYQALHKDCGEEAEAYEAQIDAIERRAELIRRCFLLLLISLTGVIVSCLLLGLGIYWKRAGAGAVAMFLVSMGCLIAGTGYYIREIVSALSAARFEAHDPRFGAPAEVGTHDSL
jgi:hypothetical protein